VFLSPDHFDIHPHSCVDGVVENPEIADAQFPLGSLIRAQPFAVPRFTARLMQQLFVDSGEDCGLVTFTKPRQILPSGLAE
jgi:hypothetical protein